jgi:hypothetical protein
MNEPLFSFLICGYPLVAPGAGILSFAVRTIGTNIRPNAIVQATIL